MKSKLFSLTAVLFTVVLVAACGKLDKVLVKKDGKWNVVSYHSHSVYHDVDTSWSIDTTYTEDTTYTNYGSYTFADDGTGTAIVDGFGISFTWSVNDDESEITFITNFGGSADTTVFEVEESGKKEQKWSSHDAYTTTFGTQTTTVTSDDELTLERAD